MLRVEVVLGGLEAPHGPIQRYRLPDVRPKLKEREFFIENLLVRIHFIIEMIWWTGLAPWEFGFTFPGILISTFLKT